MNIGDRVLVFAGTRRGDLAEVVGFEEPCWIKVKSLEAKPKVGEEWLVTHKEVVLDR